MQTAIKLLVILLLCIPAFVLYAACRVSGDCSSDVEQERWCKEHGKRKDQ